MIKIKVRLKLYSGDLKRKTPFKSGYRPLFLFPYGKLTSGSIDLIGNDQLHPNETQEVSIRFVNEDLLGRAFKVGIRGQFLSRMNHSEKLKF